MSKNLRFIAAEIINEVMHGRSLSGLKELFAKRLSEKDLSFLQALVYGVCRYYPRLEIILNALLKKPLKAKDSDLKALLLVGIYQLMAMRIPPYAAISETVHALKKHRAFGKGLVNAILREYVRKKDRIDEALKEDPIAFYAHPAWLIEAIQSASPLHAASILNANNAHPPFAIRVNLSHLSRDAYLKKLLEKNHDAVIIPETKTGLILSSPMQVEHLPGFFSGTVSVQDGAAQLAAELMDLKPNLRVLDACAAPGGKLTHLLEIEPSIQWVAIDQDKNRVEDIKDNLKRMQKKIAVEHQLICCDAKNVKAWWDGKLFDRILLDAPCSGSGVIRRHPDIKLLRKPSDIEGYTQQQWQLLLALWPLLKMGGRLVYVTCSIFVEENSGLIKRFLSDHADASEIKIDATWGILCDPGRQILPGMHRMDGFYYAMIQKKSADE